MSTNHFVYVGPYLVTKHAVAVSTTDAVVAVGRERLYPAYYDKPKQKVLWLPNVDVLGLSGSVDARYDCGKSNRSIDGWEINMECRRFVNMFRDDILAIERVHGQAETCWGVVFYSL